MWSKYCSVVVGRDKVAEVAAAGPPLNDSVINCVKQKKKKKLENVVLKSAYKLESVYLKRSLPGQALKHDGSYAPQVCLCVIVLGHNDLRSLVRKT